MAGKVADAADMLEGNKTPALEGVMAEYHKILGTGEAVPGCERCSVKCGDAPHCEDCRKKIVKEQAELMRAQKEREERWEARFRAEEAVKRRKFDAECAAIRQYYPETSRCELCTQAKKTTVGPEYCDVHMTTAERACVCGATVQRIPDLQAQRPQFPFARKHGHGSSALSLACSALLLASSALSKQQRSSALSLASSALSELVHSRSSSGTRHTGGVVPATTCTPAAAPAG
jgi:hypothetical protein